MTTSYRFVLLALVLACVAGSVFAADGVTTWRNISPEELQMKTPKVEADADAEAIFWEIWLDDKKDTSLYYDHYIRVKIFTERGQEKFSKFDIPFVKGMRIENIAARVIKPDGSIVYLDPKDILEREIVKAGKVKVRAKSFAIPSIEPGVIVEYRYRETFKDVWGNGVRLTFQRDIPMQKVAFHVRPQKGYTLIPRFYNMGAVPFVEDSSEKGFYVASMENVPAFKVEPHMPPEDEVKRWAYVTYTASFPGTVWRGVSDMYSHWLSEYATPTNLINKKAAELTAGATTDDEKLRRIYEYIQKDIKNLTYDRSLTEEQREKIDRKWDHAEDVIKTGIGNSVYIELLFASLAKALGYEVRLVFSGDRSESFFNPEKHPYRSFIHFACVAVNVQSKWKYFNSSVPFLPYGYLTWNEQGVTAMLIGEGGYNWQNIPVGDYQKSVARRTGKFTLQPDGTLEGTVTVEYTGQQAIARRRDHYLDSEAKRKEEIEEELKERLSTAELSGVTITNFDDPTKALTYSFSVKIPNYAQRTGQRLFIQPGFFEFGAKPVFSSATRQHAVHFAYPWSEADYVEINLPKGYGLDNADRPADISDPKKIASLSLVITYDKATNILRYRRQFHFGGGGEVLFPAESYAALRGLFNMFHKADSHIIALKEQQQ